MEDISGLPDFWTAYPEAAAIEVFRNLKEKRENSGAILYYIKLNHDPVYDHLRVLKPDERKEELKKWLGVEEKDLFNTKGQMYSFVQKAEEWFIDNWLDPTSRLLKDSTDKVFQAEKVMRDYEIDSPEKIAGYATFLEAFQVMKTEYDKFLMMFKTKEAVKKKHGGGEISDADSNEIFEDLE